eukprot:8914029-Pyramimonas_sp.AAC.1
MEPVSRTGAGQPPLRTRLCHTLSCCGAAARTVSALCVSSPSKTWREALFFFLAAASVNAARHET